MLIDLQVNSLAHMNLAKCILPVLFIVVGTCIVSSTYLVKELGTKAHLCHDMFTILHCGLR